MNTTRIAALAAALALSACAQIQQQVQQVKSEVVQPVQPGAAIRFVNTDYSTLILRDPAEMAMLEANNCVVYFDLDSAQIRADQTPTLDRCAKFFLDHPQAQLSLDGFADERGSSMHNLKLGERRAKAVAKALRERGVTETQIVLASRGEEAVPADARNEANFAKARRVQLGQEGTK